MARITLRQAIQTWQQRLELAGMGLVETTLEQEPARHEWSDSTATRRSASIDATLARLAGLTPGQFAVELAYPWGREAGEAGALLGIIPEACEEAIESWSQPDAA